MAQLVNLCFHHSIIIDKLDISVCPRLGTEKSFEYLNVSVKLPNVNSVHSNVTIGTCNFDSIEGVYSTCSINSCAYIDVELEYWSNVI